MEVTADVVGFLARYAATALDFLVLERPRAFAEKFDSDDQRYLEPLSFLIVSIVLSTIVAFAGALIILEGDDRASVDRIGFAGTGLFVFGIWLCNTFPIAIAKFVGFLLDVPVALRTLFYAYCYASALFPLFLVSRLFMFGPSEPSAGSLGIGIATEFIFVTVYIVAMGRFARMASRAFRRFVGLTLFCTYSAGFIAFLPLVIMEQNEESERSGRPLWNIGRTDKDTLRVRNMTSADCEECWMGSVAAKKGDTLALKIYYNYSGVAPQAIDTRVRLILPDIIRNAAPIAAEVWSADTPRRAQGAVVIQNGGNTALQFVFRGAHWYPNERDADSAAPLLREQSGAEVLTTRGLALGEVPGNICKCPGYVVVHLQCE